MMHPKIFRVMALLIISFRKEGSLTGTLGRTWIFPELYDESQVTAIIKKLDGRGKASVQVCKHTPDGSQQVAWSFTADNGKDNIGKTWSKSLNGVKDTFISITVDGKSVSNKFADEFCLGINHMRLKEQHN